MSKRPPPTSYGDNELNFDFAGLSRKAETIAASSGKGVGRTDVFSMLKSERNSMYGVSEQIMAQI